MNMAYAKITESPLGWEWPWTYAARKTGEFYDRKKEEFKEEAAKVILVTGGALLLLSLIMKK